MLADGQPQPGGERLDHSELTDGRKDLDERVLDDIVDIGGSDQPAGG